MALVGTVMKESGVVIRIGSYSLLTAKGGVTKLEGVPGVEA